MYVPFFTKQILDHNKVASENDKWNVKGFLVGNNVQIMDESFLDVSL
jgi:carboxypeptidase C (cathepsin A)